MAVKLGAYAPPSLVDEGFIHCSTREQVVSTADMLFKGQSGLALLQIEESDLETPVLYEDLYETGQLFPHIYASLKPAQVTAVIDFPCQADGTFAFPE